MDTKLKADIAESAVTTKLLKLGFRVLKPIGDRMPYDLALEENRTLLRLQVKCAWNCGGFFSVDARRTKTNRRRMLRSHYEAGDFDFAILYIDESNTFYVMPIDIFRSYKSGIALVEQKTRQRKPRSFVYREAWHLLKKIPDQPTSSPRPQSG